MKKSKKWTARQRKYMEMLVECPYMTDIELSKEIGVTTRTLSRWKKKKGFWNEVEKRIKENLSRRLPKMLDKIMDEAEEGRVYHARLILEYLEKIKNKIELEGRVEHSTSADLAEKIEQYASIYRKMAKRGVSESNSQSNGS